MYNRESVQENETHTLLWDFEIQTDHLISDRRTDRATTTTTTTTTKRNGQIVDLPVPADPKVKLKENERRYSYLDLARELKKNYGT